MTTYNWNCRTVDAYPQDGDNTDVVYNVHWIVTGGNLTLDATTTLPSWEVKTLVRAL